MYIIFITYIDINIFSNIVYLEK